MILTLKRTETAVLLLHMTITRKNVRNGFKSNYGRNGYKEILNSFDDVKTTFENAIENTEESEPEKNQVFYFNINEVNMILSFLDWYTVKLETTLKAANDIIEEDRKQIECLKEVQKKAQRMKDVQGVG